MELTKTELINKILILRNIPNDLDLFKALYNLSKEKIKSIKENQRKNINAFATSNIVDYILKN